MTPSTNSGEESAPQGRGRPRDLAEAEGSLFDVLGLEASSRRIALRDGPVAYARVLEVGEGQPVLFVHGAGMTASVWAPLLVHLPHRRSICVDLPGCGLTDPFVYGRTNLREHARAFLAGVLDALGLAAAGVVANSLGASYSLYLAAANPERVLGLALLGAPGVAFPGARGSLAMRLYSRPAVGRVLSALSPPMSPRLARGFLRSVCGHTAVANIPGEILDVVAAATRISEPTTRTLMPELFAGGRPRPELGLTDAEVAAITASTLLVWGGCDRFQPPAVGRRAAAEMPDAELVEVAGGHHPWWDGATRCAALVDEHLDAAETDG